MKKINSCLITPSKIINLKTINDTIVAYATKLDGIGFFSSKDCSIKNNIKIEYLNNKTTAVCFSNDGKLFAFANSTIIYTIHMPTQKLIKTINTDGEKIEIMEFDPSNNYIIAGSNNGRVLQYTFDSSLLLSRLCSFPYKRDEKYSKIKKNFVSSFAFYKNYLACSGYKNAIFIIDFISQSDKEAIIHSRSRIDALCFLNEDTLISGNKDGEVDIISLKNTHTYKRLNAPFGNIKQILIMPNPNYIMVASKTQIAIFDIKNYKLIDTDYIKLNANISNIIIQNNELLLMIFDDTSIIKVELPNTEKLKSLIAHNLLDKAFDLIAKEEMLKNSKEHKELEKKYKDIYIKAVEALINNDKKSAIQLTQIFKDTKQKKEEIKSLFDAFENYPQFQNHFKEKKLPIAYAMATKYPALQYTQEYKEMEKEWKEAFKCAQKQILSGKEDSAKECLKKYITIISKRESIQLILKQNKEFIDFLKAIEKKDYKKISHLCAKNELFTQIPLWHTMLENMQKDLQTAKDYMKKGDIPKAQQYLLKLHEADSIKNEVEILQSHCKEIISLQNAYKANDFKQCYEMIDLHKYLRSTNLGIMLQKHWFKIIHQCEQYAIRGDIENIKKTIKNLILINTRRGKIGDILRLGFHTKIQTMITKKQIQNAQKTIYLYIDTFGIDKEINSLMKTFENNFATKLAITYDANKKATRDSWIHSYIITGYLNNP